MSKGFKLFIKRILRFSLFAVLSYFVILILWIEILPPNFSKNFRFPLGGYGHMHTRMQEVKEIENVDIVFLGPSHAYRGFDVRIFAEAGYSSFNLGSSAQSPIQSYYLLRKYLHDLSPELIIYAVSPLIFSIDGVESTVDIIANDKIDRYSVSMAFKHTNPTVFNALLYGFYYDYIKKADYTEGLEKDEDQYIQGGFVEKALSFYTQDSVYQKQKPEFLSSQIRAFERIADLIKKEGIRLLLVHAPITSSLYNTIENRNEFDSLINNYGPYINYNVELYLIDTIHFYDDNHLNRFGVEEFNKKVVKDLDVLFGIQ